MREVTCGGFCAAQQCVSHSRCFQGFRILGIEVQSCREFLPLVGVKNRHKADKRPVITHHIGLSKNRIRFNRKFQIHRRNLFAGTGDDDFLDAAADTEQSRLVVLTDIAGLEPPVLGKGAGRVFRAVPVTLHDGRSPDLNFTGLLGKADFRPDGNAHRIGLVKCQAVACDDGGGFSHPVALNRRKTQRAECPGNFVADGRTAGDGNFEVAAELFADFC